MKLLHVLAVNNFPKSLSKARASKRAPRRQNRAQLPPTAGPRKTLEVPRPIASSQIHRFRRGVTRQFAYNPAVGWDGYPYNTMQWSYAPGGVNSRIGGTSIYTDPLPDISELAVVYDQWRVARVTVRFDFNTLVLTNNGAQTAPPILYFTTDYDSVEDTSVNQIMQYPGFKTHSFNRNGYSPCILTFKPRALRDVAGSGVSTGYSPMTDNPFIRTAELSIPHYGLKMGLLPHGATQNITTGYLLMTVFMDLEFANPK